MGFQVLGLGLSGKGSGLRVQDSCFMVSGLGFRGSRFWVSGFVSCLLGVRSRVPRIKLTVQGIGFMIWGVGSKIYGFEVRHFGV